MISLTLEQADTFVDKSDSKGIDASWNGWEMEIHEPHPKAARSVNGIYSRKTGQWGFVTTVQPNEEGVYLLNYKLSRGKSASR